MVRIQFDSLLYLVLLQNVQLPLKVGLKSGALASSGCIKITAGGTKIACVLGCLHAVVFCAKKEQKKTTAPKLMETFFFFTIYKTQMSTIGCKEDKASIIFQVLYEHQQLAVIFHGSHTLQGINLAQNITGSPFLPKVLSITR